MVKTGPGQRVATTSAPSSEDQEAIRGGTGLVSLLIFIHLVCVGVALSSNVHRSSLQARLVDVLQPYLGLVNLDPDFTPYHLTHDQPLDEDHFLEVEFVTAGESSAAAAKQQGTIVRLEGTNRWGFAGRRYRRLAYAIAYHAQAENDHVTAALARATAALALASTDARQVIVRCKHHESQPRRLTDLAAGFPEDPADRRYEQTVYEADVWLAEGKLHVQKRVTVQESARLERLSTEANESLDGQDRSTTGKLNQKE